MLDRIADGDDDIRDGAKADEAKQHLDRGEEILERLGGADSDQWPVVKHCIEAKWFRSDYANAEQRYSKSLSFLRDAVRIATSAEKRWPGQYEASLMLAESHSKLSDEMYSQDEDGIVPATQTAIKVWDELEAKYSDKYAVREGAANSIDTLATHYYELDELRKAKPLFEDLISRCELELANDETHSQFADWLILAHHVMSDIEKRLDNKDAAIDHLIAALETDEQYQHWIFQEVIEAIRKDLDTLRPPGVRKP